MPSRKRTRQEAEIEEEHVKPAEYTLLDRIRSTSEFAALIQFLFIFGKTLKVPEISIEDFEQECLLPTPSTRISEIGLALLKNISSHRGLTLDLFDEYTRRQYVAKAPDRNPFGIEEEAAKFTNFDIFTKIRTLHQLTLWTFWNPDRMRERFPDLSFDAQASDWRINPYGWDGEGRTYFLLDDDRLYRQTDPPIPEPVRKKTKAQAKGSRASKRRRLSRVVESTPEMTEDEVVEDTKVDLAMLNDLSYEENFADRKWECVAISFDDYQNLITSIKKSRDPDERTMCKRLENEMMPFLNKKEEERQKQELRRQKELATLQMLASAKRSSRLANKAEQQREQEIEQEAERKRLADLKMAQKELQKQQQLEEDRESRMQTREQRLREREVKRILHEEELRKEEEKLAQLAAEEANGGPAGRVAHRQLMADMEKRQKELDALQAEEDQWEFDCSVCGVHGQNIDDGTHSIACDKCNVWQHSACHGIAQEQAERDDFQFICKQCKQKANLVPPIKLNMSASVNGATSSPAVPIPNKEPNTPKEKKEKRGRPPKDPNKPRSNIKIVKKKDSKASSQNSTPAKPMKQSPAVSLTVNGSGSFTTTGALTSNLQSTTATPLTYVRPPLPAPTAGNGFIHYQPVAPPRANIDAAKPQSQSNNDFHRPSLPSSSSTREPERNGGSSFGSQGDPPTTSFQSNGYSSSPVRQPSTPLHFTNAAPVQPQIATAPSSFEPPSSTQKAPSSQIPPRTPSYVHPTAHTLSSPAQHLTAPSPTHQAPALGVSESSIHGSSPGYSPKKHPSPPRSSSNIHHFAAKDNPIKPPVALSPVSRPNITVPPVKKSPPPPVYHQSEPLTVAGLAESTPLPQQSSKALQPDHHSHEPEHQSERQSPQRPAVFAQNVTLNGQS